MADEPAGVGHNSQPAAGATLRGLIQRIEHIQGEIDEHLEDRKEIYKEAKGQGFDGKILRKVIARRRRRPEEVAAEETMLDTYLSAIGVLD